MAVKQVEIDEFRAVGNGDLIVPCQMIVAGADGDSLVTAAFRLNWKKDPALQAAVEALEAAIDARIKKDMDIAEPSRIVLPS